MKKLSIILALLLFVSLAFASQVNVSTWGFNLDLLDKNISEPFLKEYGIQVVRDLGNNSVRLTKLLTQKNNPVIDVAHFADYYAQLGRVEELFEPIDVSKLENYDELFDFAKDPIGGNYALAYAVSSYGIVYRTDLIEDPITSWKDFWREDVAGYISLPDFTITQGPAFMMHINKIFGAPEGDETLDTAFAKLSEIKKDVVTFYRTSSELINLFQMGEVWMSPAPRFSWGQFMGTGLPLAFVIPEEGVLGFFSTVSVVKNAPNRDAAYKYIDFILSNSVQTAQAIDLVDSPVNKNVVVPEDKAAFLTVGDEAASLIFYDIETTVRNREVWLEKWNKFLGQ